MAGSFSEKSLFDNKEASGLKQQEGFGITESSKSSLQTSLPRGLDKQVLNAMQFATIKTNEVTYVPKLK